MEHINMNNNTENNTLKPISNETLTAKNEKSNSNSSLKIYNYIGSDDNLTNSLSSND